MDFDRHELRFFENTGNHSFGCSPGLRRIYQPYLLLRWPEWRVAWSAEGIIELDARAGLPAPDADARAPVATDPAMLRDRLGVCGAVLGRPCSW